MLELKLALTIGLGLLILANVIVLLAYRDKLRLEDLKRKANAKKTRR